MTFDVTIVEKWVTWPDCKKPTHMKMNMLLAQIGVEGRPPDKVNPSTGSVNAADSKNGMATDCISMQSDISNGGKLLFLVDTGSDISLLKPYKLDKTKQFDPEGRVKVKGMNGSTFQTLGTVQAVLYEGSIRISFMFQLIDKWVDHPCDGILGRDFLAHAGAKICYKTGTSMLGTGCTKIHKVLMPMNAKGQPKGVWRLVLPGRAEMWLGCRSRGQLMKVSRKNKKYEKECISRGQSRKYRQAMLQPAL